VCFLGGQGVKTAHRPLLAPDKALLKLLMSAAADDGMAQCM
jgi:hypothetical protein